MEKLIELLNEYDPHIASDWEFRDNFWYFIYKWWSAIFPKEIWMLKIISKQYWFIKWLVENDKIDRTDIPTWFDYEYQWRKGIYCVSYEVNILTMRLSISDRPIEDLISYLK